MDEFLQAMFFQGLDQDMHMIVHYYAGIKLKPTTIKVLESRHYHAAFVGGQFGLGWRQTPGNKINRSSQTPMRHPSAVDYQLVF